MDDFKDQLLKVLEKTSIKIKIDKSLTEDEEWDSEESINSKKTPEPETSYYSSTFSIDNHRSLTNYQGFLDHLFELTKKYLEDESGKIVSKKDQLQFLKKISLLSIYLFKDIDFDNYHGFRLYYQILPYKTSTKLFLEPNLEIDLEGGLIFDVDFGKNFDVHYRPFLYSKQHFINRLVQLIEYNSGLRDSSDQNPKPQSLKLQDPNLLQDKRFTDFKKRLVDFEFIENIELPNFTKCFSGEKIEKKVNWIDSELSLVYFVKRLDYLHLIEKKEKWIALSNSFLLNSKPIDYKKISHTTAICKSSTRRTIRDFINDLTVKPGKI